MTRIAYLHQYFSTPAMSNGTRSYEFAKRLARVGHDVHIVAADGNARRSGATWRVEKMDGFTVHWLPVPYSNNMTFRRRVLAFLHFATRSSSRARSLKADIVVATSTPLTIAIPGVIAKLGRGIPMVFEVRDLWPTMPIAVGALRGRAFIAAARALERFAYRNAERIIALSPGMADGVLHSGYPSERLEVIPNGADLELFTVDEGAVDEWRAGHPRFGDRHLVTYTGTFGLVNGVGYLVEVADRLRHIDPSIVILLVGSGAERELVRARAESLGVLNKNLFIEDPLPKREIPLVLAASSMVASVFIPIPEMESNSANKFFDGLAAARPLVINYGGWQLDLLEKHGAGLHLDPADPESAAQAISDAIKDLDGLKRMGAKARLLAETEFSRDQLSERFIAVIEQALVEGGSRSAGRGRKLRKAQSPRPV